MWRISPICDDWVDKGCHIHINQIELAVRPNHLSEVVFRKVFSSTTDQDLDLANRIATNLLGDPEFRRKLIDSLERAMEHMLGVTGQKAPRARGRLREFNFLIINLRLLGTP
jgi:hypothetical protein